MDIITLLCILLVMLSPFLIYWNPDPIQKRASRIISSLPGPLTMPLLGHVYLMIGVKRRDVWSIIDRVTYRYWPIFRMWNGSIPEIHLCEADHIEPILRSSVNITKGWMYDNLQPWLGTGLLTSGGQKWFSHRKLITPTFHFKILEAFQEVFAAKSQILVEKLEKEVGNEKGFDVYPYITHCALDIICETAMGTQLNAQEDSHSSYVTAIYGLSELTVKRWFTPWFRSDFLYSFTENGKKYFKYLEEVHSFTSKVIKEKGQTLKEKTKLQNQDDFDDLGRKRRVAFLDLLLEAAEDGTKLTDEEIREEVDTFMFEGHDTTSASMCWILFLLGNHPSVQERVFEEQEAIFQDSDRSPSVEDLSEMKYLEQVIKETLRLYPSVPLIGRRLTEDVKVAEYTFPEGAHAAVHIYHAHRNPKYFPEPEIFDPDRFLPENVQGRHPYAYIPFSAGSRNCIGQKFALLEEKTVISAIMRKYRVRALDRPADITVVGELVMRPADGIRLVIERR